MHTHGTARRPPRRVTLALIAASTVVGLGGCGTASGDSPSRGVPAASSDVAAATLCSAARQPAQVTARLTASHAREILPRSATITDAARVRALAAALCALPRLPRGPKCPATPVARSSCGPGPRTR